MKIITENNGRTTILDEVKLEKSIFNFSNVDFWDSNEIAIGINLKANNSLGEEVRWENLKSNEESALLIDDTKTKYTLLLNTDNLQESRLCVKVYPLKMTAEEKQAYINDLYTMYDNAPVEEWGGMGLADYSKCQFEEFCKTTDEYYSNENWQENNNEEPGIFDLQFSDDELKMLDNVICKVEAMFPMMVAV
jgi:hypothetical protein